MRNAIFALAFLGGLVLASGIYFGLKIESGRLLGKIGQNDFQLVEKINLTENSKNKKSEAVQKEKIVSKNSKKSKKKIEQNISESVVIIPVAVPTTTAATTTFASQPADQTANQNNIIISESAPAQISENISQSNNNNSANHILISEVMAGADGNSAYEFVELYNPTASAIDLTGWTIKKISLTGSESSLLVASRLEGKIIGAGKYFLAVNEGGYNGQVAADVFWAASNTLAYSNNAIILYNSKAEKIEEINWSEISKGQSYGRQSWENNQFSLQSPTPQNSSY